MKKLMFAFIALAALCAARQEAYAQPPDSCLKLLYSAEGDTTWSNPDSVTADSCFASPTYGQLYAQGWFDIRFSYYVIPTPVGPEDTVIERTWHDIDTQYANVRSAFANLEAKYGGFVFRKVQPHWDDTSSGGDKLFRIWFEGYVNIDSVVSVLVNVPTVERAIYKMRAGRYLASVELSMRSNLSPYKKLILSRLGPSSHQSELFGSIFDTSTKVDIYTSQGMHLFRLDEGFFLEKLQAMLYALPNGTYIVRGNKFTVLLQIIG